jgi:glycerophosphoryl diester phosphodiesterase
LPDLPSEFLARPIAHRALHGVAGPENSPAAIAAAINAGYGIELDLQISADGVAMVFHDATLDRLTTASGPINARTAAELAQIALGNGEPIPSLRAVLAQVGGRVPLLIEIKDQSGCLGPVAEHLEQDMAAALAAYSGPVAVMSFNPFSMIAMARLAPNVPRGLVTCAFTPQDWPGISAPRLADLADIQDFGPASASFISHDWTDLDAAPVALLKAQGIPVLCWTIRNARQAQHSLALADNITFEGYTP